MMDGFFFSERYSTESIIIILSFSHYFYSDAATVYGISIIEPINVIIISLILVIVKNEFQLN